MRAWIAHRSFAYIIHYPGMQKVNNTTDKRCFMTVIGIFYWWRATKNSLSVCFALIYICVNEYCIHICVWCSVYMCI